MILTKLNSSNYVLSNNVWNMESCEFTKQFTEQVACKNREPYIFEQNGKYIACCDLVLDYGEYTQKDIKNLNIGAQKNATDFCCIFYMLYCTLIKVLL